MSKKKLAAAVAGCIVAAGTIAAANGAPPPNNGGLPQPGDNVILNPANFSNSLNITNPYWPMQVGNRWVFEETDTTGGRQKVIVEVTNGTKVIDVGAGNTITARVVRDTVSVRNTLVEKTDDYFAQDNAGNIWYLGEFVTNYEKGKPVDNHGSFEHGVGGAQGGIAMPAPALLEPELCYRQEDAPPDAVDRACVVTVGKERVEVPVGFFDAGVLMTRDLVPTEPHVQELKFYAPGTGPLLSVHLDGDGGRATLVSTNVGP